MSEFGYVMSGDKAVAKVENGNVTPILENLMPAYLKRKKILKAGFVKEQSINTVQIQDY